MSNLINSYSLSSVIGIGTDTPNQNLTVVGGISSSATVYDKIGNSNQWNTSYTYLTGNSATLATRSYVGANYFPLSGGIINGFTALLSSAQIYGNLTVNGNLTATGTTTFANTRFTTTSALSVINTGVGPALYVQQAVGPSDIASFYNSGGVEVLHIGTINPITYQGKVGVNTGAPNNELTVVGSISATGNFNTNGAIDAYTGNFTNPGINQANFLALNVVGAGSQSVYQELQNTYAGVSASTDISIFNDTGNYLDIGINSSLYNGNLFTPTFNIVTANDGYIYNANNGNFAAGTAGSGDIVLFAGGTLSGTTTQSGNERLRVKSSGNVGIGTSTPAAILDVAGNIYAGDQAGSYVNTIATGSPEIDFGVDGQRKMVFGYDPNVPRGIFYSNDVGGGVYFYDSDGIAIGNNAGTYSGNILKIPKTWDQVNIDGLITANGGNSDQWNEAYSNSTAQVYQAGSGINSIQPINGSNTASGRYTNVASGYCNTASGYYSNVAGGIYNTACGGCSNVAGGFCNTASGYYSNVAGGFCNNASCNYSNVAGGRCNTASEYASVVAGGSNNIASGHHSFIGAGSSNVASGFYSLVAGGCSNNACGCYSNVSGGVCNTACGVNSNVAGGYCNIASGCYSAILGGCNSNTNCFSNTFILGSNLKASQANFTYVNNLSSQGLVSANAVTTNVVTASSIVVSKALDNTIFNVPLLTVTGANNGSVFAQIQNTTAGLSASTDISLYNDLGTIYLDMGINSSTYNGNIYSPRFNVVGPNDSYFYSTSANLGIGNTGTAGDLIFFTGGSLSGTSVNSGNERLRIKNTNASGNGGFVGINTSNPNQQLTVVGNISATGNLATNTNYVVVAALTANQTMPSSTDAVLTLDPKNDPNNWFSRTAGVGLTARRITPTIPGYYHINYQVSWQPGLSSNGAQNNIQIMKVSGGVTSTISLVQQPIFNTSINTTQYTTAVTFMNGSTDYLYFQGYSSNAAQVITGETNGNWTKAEIFKIN